MRAVCLFKKMRAKSAENLVYIGCCWCLHDYIGAPANQIVFHSPMYTIVMTKFFSIPL